MDTILPDVADARVDVADRAAEHDKAVINPEGDDKEIDDDHKPYECRGGFHRYQR